MRKLSYVVETPKGTCIVDTLARAKEIEEMYGGSHKQIVTEIEPEPLTFSEKRKAIRKVAVAN